MKNILLLTNIDYYFIQSPVDRYKDITSLNAYIYIYIYKCQSCKIDS